MKTLTNILLLFLPAILSAQGFLPMDTIEAPFTLMDVISNQVTTTFYVDFDGDGTQDYICRTDFLDKSEPYYIEYWITSDFEVIKEKTRYMLDFDFYWFVNLDSDLEPEIFSATGWPERIDYCFIDQDLKTGIDSVMCYFNPIILEDNYRFWGYPWDIKDLMIRRQDGTIQLFCSVDHDIQRDGEVTVPDWQNLYPVIFFSGHSIQRNIKIEEVRDLKWISIDEIKKRTHNKRYNQ